MLNFCLNVSLIFQHGCKTASFLSLFLVVALVNQCKINFHIDTNSNITLLGRWIKLKAHLQLLLWTIINQRLARQKASLGCWSVMSYVIECMGHVGRQFKKLSSRLCIRLTLRLLDFKIGQTQAQRHYNWSFTIQLMSEKSHRPQPLH